MPKLLKVKPLKEVLLWVKSSVSIKFKLSDKTVPVLAISLSKFVTSIVTVSASIVELLWLEKSFPTVTLKLSALIVALAALRNVSAAIVRLPVGFMVALLVNVSAVIVRFPSRPIV